MLTPRWRITAFLLFTLAALPVQAQERIRLGAKVGLTSSEVRNSAGGFGDRLGLNAGAFAIVPVRGAFGVLVDASYYRKGYEFEGEFRDENNLVVAENPDYQYDYASLLVAARYSEFLGDGPARFFAFAGPRLDLLLGDRVVATIDGDREEFEIDSRFAEPPFNSEVFGFAAGVGVRVAPVLIELRYDADITPARDGRTDSRNDYRFRVFSLRLGVAI